MKESFKRYDESMLQALAAQPVLALLLNAVVRAVAFTVALQVISLLSGLVMSSVAQMLILVLVFTVLIFSFDILEKYWAQRRLQKRF